MLKMIRLQKQLYRLMSLEMKRKASGFATSKRKCWSLNGAIQNLKQIRTIENLKKLNKNLPVIEEDQPRDSS